MNGRDSCLQPDTRSSSGISGNVFEDLPAPSEPSAAFFGNSRSSASAQCELVSLNTGRLADRVKQLERNTQNFCNTHTEICKEVFNLESFSHGEGAYPQNCMVEQPKNQVSEMHFEKFLDPSTFQCWKRVFMTEVPAFPRTLCNGSKRWRWSNQCTIFKTSRSIGGHRFMNIEILGAKIASAFKKIITNPHFKKRVNLEEQKALMQDRILRGRQIAFFDPRILPSHWST